MSVLQAATLLPHLTDGEVLAALEKLTSQVRAKGLPHFQEQPSDTDGLIAWLIVHSWKDLFRRRARLSKRDMAGCLQTVAESARTHVRKPGGRSYLKYLKKFMKRAGVSIQVLPMSEAEDIEVTEESTHDLERMSLADLGLLWLDKPGYHESETVFGRRVRERVAQGQSRQIIELCQTLMEQTADSSKRAILCILQGIAYRHLDQLEQAVTVFQSARSTDPTNVGALDEMAETYCEMGQYERAIQAWQEALEHGPSAPTYYYPRIAQACRQVDDLVGEEKAWRDLVKARERRGFWARLGRRSQSVAALTYLADCLRRQGKMDEWQEVSRQLRRSWPHHDDPFDDWAYWVRHRLEREHMIASLLGALRDAERLMPTPAWSQILQACIYDWQREPRQAAPLWRNVRQKLSSTPLRSVLAQARDILGELLPKSSGLFDLTKEA
jgi:tetratricopeptide (TPR) repeat protein